jgi:hypothetical protein
MLLLSLNLGGQVAQQPHVVDGSKRRRRLYLGPEDQPAKKVEPQQVEVLPEPAEQPVEFVGPVMRVAPQIVFAPVRPLPAAVTWPDRVSFDESDDDLAAMAAAEVLLM